MAYTYKVYGTGDVDNAVNNYNRVASSAPTYADSYDTRQARQQADNYANSYTDKINKGYTSKYKGTIDELANQYQKINLTGLPKILLNISRQKRNIPVRARLHRKTCREVMPLTQAVTAIHIHRLQDKRHSASIWTSLQIRFQHLKMKPTRVISNSRKIH